jgi:S-adenosylmethionine:tRNA ribosyltransferase-isomerase
VSTLAATLPEPAEASGPPEERGLARDGVRLMVASPSRLLHASFAALPDLLLPGDLLVVNTSRTLPAALPARRADGEALTLNLSTPVPDAIAPVRAEPGPSRTTAIAPVRAEPGPSRTTAIAPVRAEPGPSRTTELRGRWVVELRRAETAARDAHAGERLSLPAGGRVELVAPFRGTRLWIAALALPEPLLDYLDHNGRPIRYRHLDGEWPLELHQTVYATEPGSAEMPSAGRPFTPELIARLVARGIDLAPVVLHTGVSSLESDEAPYPERYRVPAWTAERVNLARRLGGRVIAVGTTVVRALESAVAHDGRVGQAAGWTELVIGPERGVRAIDGIVTGFHDRDSSHLWMLEAIADRELLERAYRAAAAAGYLRHEFGDLLLIEPG